MTGASPRILPAGDTALLIEFPADDGRIDPAVNARAVAIAASIEERALSGVRDVVPAYRSVTVFFDPLRTDTEALRSDIEQACLIERTFEGGPSAAPLEIPVCYGGSRGPDLERVATFASLSTPEVIALHAGVTYRVFMLGFFPGFAYMGTVDPRIAAPRRESPRVKVPRGSVAIAGPQTGIYPSETPGGWQVIGQSPIRPFDLRRPEPFLFKAGDAVQFVPIDEDRFLQLAGAD